MSYKIITRFNKYNLLTKYAQIATKIYLVYSINRLKIKTSFTVLNVKVLHHLGENILWNIETRGNLMLIRICRGFKKKAKSAKLVLNLYKTMTKIKTTTSLCQTTTKVVMNLMLRTSSKKGKQNRLKLIVP